MGIILILVYAIISAFGMVLLRIGSVQSTLSVVQGNFNMSISLVLIVGFILYVVTFFLWLIILQKFNITFVSPIAYGIAFIMICIISYFLLGEMISGIQYLGVILIIIGVLIMSITNKNSEKI
jgi:EamA-like transporter family.